MNILDKKYRKFLFISIAVFACILCSVVAIIYSATPAGKASSTERALAEIATQTEKARPTNTPLPTDTPLFSNTPLRTNTPLPTNTPKPTSTPKPTNTPAPSNTPTTPPTPLAFAGNGDSIVDVETSGPALVHIVGNSSSRFFAVINYDANNEQIDLLVNTTDPYDGIRPLDFMEDEQTYRFEVKADGEWTIEVLPLSSIYKLEIPGEISGKGDYVFAIIGGTPDTAIINGNASSRYFGVFGYGDRKDLLVNTTDPYNGTVLLSSDTFIIEVRAEDDWTINIKTR
jgi:hypothetical protein